MGCKRCQILEQHLVARAVGGIEIDLTNLQQREVPLAILGRTDEAGERVAGAQVEAANLARADVNIVGACQIRAVGGAQEAEAVLQDLQHAIAVDVLAVTGVGLEDREDDVLLARAGHALQAHGLGKLDQISDRLGLQLREVHGGARLGQLRCTDDLPVFATVKRFLLQLVIRSTVGAVTVTVAVAVVVAAAVIAIAITIAVAMARALVGPIAPLITQIPSHRVDPCDLGMAPSVFRFDSRKADSCDLDTAPTFWASTDPFLNKMRVGIPRMP